MIKNIENFNINAIIKYEKVKLPEELVLKINDFSGYYIFFFF